MCDTDHTDDSTPKVYEASWHVAKKSNRHRCTACGESIPRGAEYWKCRGFWYDAWRGYKHCVRCHAIYEFADRLAQVYGDYADLDLNCGEEADPDAEEQDFAFMLPSDRRVVAIGVGP